MSSTCFLAARRWRSVFQGAPTRSYSTANTFSYTPSEAGAYKVKVYAKDTEGTKVYKSSAKIKVS